MEEKWTKSTETNHANDMHTRLCEREKNNVRVSKDSNTVIPIFFFASTVHLIKKRKKKTKQLTMERQYLYTRKV